MILFRKHDERKIRTDYNEIRKISIERDYECLIILKTLVEALAGDSEKNSCFPSFKIKVQNIFN